MEYTTDSNDLLKRAFGLIGTTAFFVEKTDEKTVVLTFEYIGCFNCELTLFSCRFEREFEGCYVSKGDCSFEKNGKENFIKFPDFALDDDIKSTTIFFESAKATFRVCNAFKSVGFFSNEPWHRLCKICSAITAKGALFPELLNEKEKEILPLVLFVFAIGNPADAVKFKVSDDFYRLAKENGTKKVTELLDRFAFSMGKKKIKATAELFFELNKAENKKLFQKVYEIVLLSQKDYPSFTDENESLLKKVLEKRVEITRTLHSLGYTGEYPLFSKRKNIKFATFESYGMAYSLIGEKDVFCAVDFAEISPDESDVIIVALSGTMMAKKKTTENTDALSCFFNAKGSSRGEHTEYVVSADNAAISRSERAADSFALVAAKRAELKNLSKGEAEYLGKKHRSFWVYLFMAPFFGIGCSVLFTPAMMAFTSIIEHVSFIETAKDPLWRDIFLYFSLIAGVLFSFAMFIVEKITSKK